MRMYSHAMKIANGVKTGTTHMMNKKEATKARPPVSAERADCSNPPSTTPMSEVNRFRIRPMGVTSKNRDGALIKRLSIALKSFLEACKLAKYPRAMYASVASAPAREVHVYNISQGTASSSGSGRRSRGELCTINAPELEPLFSYASDHLAKKS